MTDTPGSSGDLVRHSTFGRTLPAPVPIDRRPSDIAYGGRTVRVRRRRRLDDGCGKPSDRLPDAAQPSQPRSPK